LHRARHHQHQEPLVALEQVALVQLDLPQQPLVQQREQQQP
jgi:hypothetical protein